jgi:hypothetical protein
VKREVLYNILTECGITIKLVKLIKMCLNETYSKVRIGLIVFLSNMVKNKEMLYHHCFSTLHYYANRNDQENLLALKLNGTYQLLAYSHNQNLIQEEIMKRFNSDNACYHSFEMFLSSRMLSKNEMVRIYKTVTLPLVLYGCEAWSLTLREVHELRGIDNRLLRRIVGPKRDGVTRGWRKLVGKPEEKRSLGRPRRRCIDKIKLDLLAKEWDGLDWIGLTQDRKKWRALVNSVMNLRGSIKCWETTEWLHNLWPLEWHSAPDNQSFST